MPSFRERIEEMAGVAVRPYEDTRVQETSFQNLAAFADEAEDLAIQTLGYLEGRPHEVTANRRRELSQRSRVAYIKDPLAGAEGEMRANFAFGRGVSKPTAKDPEVQKVIDRFWTDPVNQKKLTSFEAQRLRSNDLLTQGNLFCGYFDHSGSIRVAFLDADLVTDVVVSDEDDELPLWYAVRKKKREWDYNRDGEKPVPFEIGSDGLARTWYYRHWRNVDVAEADATDRGESFEERPPDSKIADGRIEHFRVNRVGRTQFGVPPWARVLRYFCHDLETETLTTEGWMKLPELKRRWESGTLPPVAGCRNGEMVFEPAEAMNVQDYRGELMQFKTKRGFDFLVTPNHRMLTERGHVEAVELESGQRLAAPLVAPVEDRPRVEEFTLPAATAKRPMRADSKMLRRGEHRRDQVMALVEAGKSNREIADSLDVTIQYAWQIRKRRGERAPHPPMMLPEKALSMDAWLAWLGWWVSEGDTRCSLSQELTSDRLSAVQKACADLEAAGIEGIASATESTWRWKPRRPRQILCWLRENTDVGSYAKKLPSFVFDLPRSQQMILLRALMGGDGTPTEWEAEGYGRYATVSEQLAEDIQRLATLCGFRSLVSRSIEGRSRPIFQVSINEVGKRLLPRPVRVPYSGEVYCFTTPSGNLVTRRNGVIGISGNSAMNQFNEARVSMAQAAASIIAKRVIRGGPKGVVKAASNVLSQAGELAQARFRRRPDEIAPTGPGTNPSRGFAPPPPGSIWTENESDSLQAMNLNSGGPAAAADQQILMAPIAAASQFGTHYFGNLNDAGLASATTVELPTLMNVSSWQELFEQILRFYTNRSIQAAVRAGHLGGIISESEEDDGRPLNELVYEEDREEMEKRTGKDLSYSFSMPYPGRRNLPDVINTVATAVEAYDPEGRNPWLRRYFMEFLLQTLEVEDPAAALDLFLKLPEGMDEAPPELALEAFAQMMEPTEPNPDGTPDGGTVPPRVPRGGKPSEKQSQNGERRASTPPKREMGGKGGGEVQEELIEDAADGLARALAADADAEFDRLLADPAAFLGGRAPAGKAELNGHAA